MPSVVAAAIVAAVAIYRGGLPRDAGLPADPERLHRRSGEFSSTMGRVLRRHRLVPVFVLFVSGGAPLKADGRPMVLSRIPPSSTMENSDKVVGPHCRRVSQASEPARRNHSPPLRPAGLRIPGAETFRLEGSPPPHVRGPHARLLLHGVLGVLRAGRQFDHQLYRSQRAAGLRRGRRARVVGPEDVGKTIRCNRPRSSSATTTASRCSP